MGFLTNEGRKRLHLIDDNQRFLRSLKELDQLPGREIIKAGIVYVGLGQEEQNEILKNEAGSELYSEFVRGMGWTVDLKTHNGFIGGLDRINFSAGKTAPYYSTASLELIFHVSTLMPSNKNDEKQIEKKKHIGNDFVHVVWSEHKRDYRPTTIVSNFNDFHIVIYPLPNGLFRIQINRKEKILFVGPLLDGMVVNKRILCQLVRQTAIHASRRARALTLVQRPFPTRNILIREMIERYKTVKTFDEFLSDFFPSPKPATPPTQAAPSSGWVSAT